MYFKINKRLFVHKAFILLPCTFVPGFKSRFYFVMLLFAVLHEAAHAVAAFLLGNHTEKIYISPYGCELRLACAAPSSEVVILLSGPVFSLFLALGAFFLGFTDIFRANIFLFSLNILPAYPLDGGKLLKIALWNLLGVYRGNRILKKVSLAIAVCLFCTSLFFGSVWLFVIAALILRRTKDLHATPFYKKRRKITPVKIFTAAHSITVLEALRLFSPYYYAYIFIAGKNLIYTEREIIGIAKDGDYTKLL